MRSSGELNSSKPQYIIGNYHTPGFYCTSKVLSYRAPLPSTAGRDYVGSPLDLVFYKDSNRVCVYVPILNDFLVEDLHEMFFVDFTARSELVIFNVSRATVTIQDTDSKFTI